MYIKRGALELDCLGVHPSSSVSLRCLFSEAQRGCDVCVSGGMQRPGSGNSKVKDTEAGVSLVCLRSRSVPQQAGQ